MILNYRKDKSDNPTIGCIVLTNPIFFSEQDWIEVPADWGRSIVQGKSYDTESEVGQSIWRQVEARLEKYLFIEPKDVGKSQLLLEEPERRLKNKSLQAWSKSISANITGGELSGS